MNRLLLAIQAFLKAFKAPQATKAFLESANLPVQKEPLKKNASTQSHLQLLALLQQSGRFIDFLQEDISQFNDAQVGAVVRSIHAGCQKTIEEQVTVRPVMDQAEGSKITVPAGYDAAEIKIVGKVMGQPPFHGVIVHRGWRAHKKALQIKVGEYNQEVIAPAEIEVQN